MSIGLSGILLPVKDMVMIYQFTPVMSSVVETSLKRFLHSLRSFVIELLHERQREKWQLV